MSSILAVPSPQTRYLPEENPFQTLVVDVTHLCKAPCKNRYLPSRGLPVMDLDWLCAILSRLPCRTRICIIGAEATTRKGLPNIITKVRQLGHTPILWTNGLKIANHNYLKTLKQAGLRSVYLSFNGGFNEQVYQAIDNLACAALKRRALENLITENMCISLGMILVRGVNETQLENVFHYAKTIRQIYELNVRSVGLVGRHMDTVPFTLEEMIRVFSELSGVDEGWFQAQRTHLTELVFHIERLKIQLTQCSALGSPSRGRLASDGTLHPFFEQVLD